MANKRLFKSVPGARLPAADAYNEEGAAAYRFKETHALAQYAATGCLNGTFYATAETQLKQVLRLCRRVDPQFIARAAIYARQTALMKDLPALLCAVLSTRAPGLLAEIFDRVIDAPKMLRNFVQIMRSGAVGRKSLGTLPKRLIARWLERRTDAQLFIGSVGADPSLADIVRMVHPRPANAARAALYGYLMDRPHDAMALPPVVRAFEEYKAARDRRTLDVPDVPFQMLTALNLGEREWKAIAQRSAWQALRMNLNTFSRHRVFDDTAITREIAARLRNPEQIRRAKVFPYQLMVACTMLDSRVPREIHESLQDALDESIANVPKIDGKVYVFPDISGSMHSPATGRRRGSTSVVRCVDVAALIAAAVLRNNPTAEVIPFESDAIPPQRVGLNPRDSVLTNAQKLASLPCGGTNCSAPLRFLNKRKATGDLIVYVSDYESWIDSPLYGHVGGSATQTMEEWARFKRRNREARMICIDLQPFGTTQAKERDDIINVGGFSDAVFDLMSAVANGQASADHWLRRIDEIRLYHDRPQRGHDLQPRVAKP